MASVADVAESDFAPFYDAFIPGLKDLLRLSGGKEYRMLRGKAMECVSLIGVAVGKEKFGADAKEVMELLIATQQGAELDADDPQVDTTPTYPSNTPIHPFTHPFHPSAHPSTHPSTHPTNTPLHTPHSLPRAQRRPPPE